MFSSVGSHAGTSLPNDPLRASLNERSSHQQGSGRPFPVSRHRLAPTRQGDLKPYPLPQGERSRPYGLDHALNRKEGDLIIGAASGSAIATLVERTSRYVMLAHLGRDRSADTVRDSLIDTVRQMPEALRGTLTWDQGAEMSEHRAFTIATDMQVYFCEPGSPWQRGTNENTVSIGSGSLGPCVRLVPAARGDSREY